MSCTICNSSRQAEFPAEMYIHFPGIENADKPGVFVFQKLLVCEDCGSSLFITPVPELARLTGVASARSVTTVTEGGEVVSSL